MLRIIFLIMFSSSALADCDISKFDIKHMRESHEQFKIEPNKENANTFYTSLPNKFCVYNEIYGYPRGSAGPLYGLALYKTLPSLASFIKPEILAKKYVSLASEGKWDADSVNFLKHSYNKLFINNPTIVINQIEPLSKSKRKTAISFLFDGPHPRKSFISSKLKNEICVSNKKFCLELNQVEANLIANEHRH